MSWGERLFRLLILAYPRSFRKRYHEDLVTFFLLDRQRAYGSRHFLRFWRKTIWDLLRTSITQRFAGLRARMVIPRGQVRPQRHMRQAAFVDTILLDLRQAGRHFIRHPGFTCIVLTTLTLGMGVTASMFSVLHAVLLDDLPYQEPERVVAIWGSDTDGRFDVSENERLRFQEQTNVFASFGTYRFDWANLTAPDGAERVVVAYIDAGVLPALGVAPRAGRGFTPDETRPGNHARILLSHGLWRQRYASDPAVIGRTISVGGAEFTVVGVMPDDFRLPGDFAGPPVQLYAPDVFGDPDPRNIHYLRAVARLVDGETVASARAYLASLAPLLKEQLPTLPPTFVPVVTPIRDVVVGEIRPVLLILFAAVSLLLLIAAVNVANIFLVRSEERSAEMAVRVALGAGRRRIARQLMTESFLVAMVSGGLGLLVAKLVTVALVRLNPPNVPRIDQLHINMSVFVFTAFIACGAALFFGMAPVFTGARQDLRAMTHDGGRGATSSKRKHRLRGVLVIAEVAIAIILVTGSGLLVRSFVQLQGVETGMRVERTVTMQTTLPVSRYGDAESGRAFYRSLLDRVRSLPSVTSAGATSALPLASSPGDWGIRIEGREEERLASGRRPWANRIIVTDGYFEALSIALLEGRTFTARDAVGGLQVAIINEAAARRYWPGESAIGKRFILSTNLDSVYRTVVGVTQNVKHLGLSSDVRPEMYLPHAQHPANANFAVGTMDLVVHSSSDPVLLVESIRQIVRALDSEVPVSNVRAMEDVLSASTSTERINMSLFSVFGGLGLLLVSVGVYGVMSYVVSRRTREMGIRIALGAAPTSVLRMVLRQGMLLTITGVAIGLFGAIAMGRLLSGLLFGVSWYDPISLAAGPVIVTIAALLACVYPALMATRVDPVRALRTD